MDKTLEVHVVTYGKVLEGEGKIKSSLKESRYDFVAKALEQSIVEIDEAEYASCIDGRCVSCLRSGAGGAIRPRKAGASISPFAAMGLGDRNFLEGLQDNATDLTDVFEQISELQNFLGNKESAHEDCGAAVGLVKHVRSISEMEPDSPTVIFIREVVSGSYPNENHEELINNSISQAGGFAEILENLCWNGELYVHNVVDKNPYGVEVLKTKDDEVNGHAEQFIAIIDGPLDDSGRPAHTVDKDKFKELTGLEGFIVNLDELRRDAEILGSTEKQKAQLFTASLLHLAGAYKNLGDGSHPLFLIQNQRT